MLLNVIKKGTPYQYDMNRGIARRPQPKHKDAVYPCFGYSIFACSGLLWKLAIFCSELKQSTVLN